MSCTHNCEALCTEKDGTGNRTPKPPSVSEDGMKQSKWPGCHYRVKRGDAPWIAIQQEQTVPKEVRIQVSG